MHGAHSVHYMFQSVCVYSRACALLWKRSLFPCCVPGIEAAHDLQVNKPETRGATKHTHAHILPHMLNYGLMLSRRCPLFFSLLHRLALSRPPHYPTHTHYSTSHVSLNTAYQSFCFADFPFPCTDKTLHSQVLLFWLKLSSSSTVVAIWNLCETCAHFYTTIRQVGLR